MSFPQDNADIPSVNAGVDPDCFPTEWGTFNDMADLILSLPDGCVAATFDIASAYRIIPIRPNQQWALCILWCGCVYVNRALMFRLSSSAGVFGSVADMLVAIYEKAGFGPIRKWVDDFFVIHLPHQDWTEEEFIQLSAFFRVPWSLEKLQAFATIQRYIGFNWDVARRTISLPQEKMKKILALLQDWLKSGSRFTANEAASLHGKLVHVSSIFPLMHPFLRSIATFANGFKSLRARLHVPSTLAVDLQWVSQILAISPCERPLQEQQPIDLQWWGDASSSFGIGVVVGQHWAAWKWKEMLESTMLSVGEQRLYSQSKYLLESTTLR